jgi:halocyanin-like protein
MPEHTRRQVLATTGALLGAGLLAGPASAAEGTDLTEWFARTDNVSLTDARGQATVEIGVGTQGNGGQFAFDPVAVRVDPGTEVVWTWTGQGGSHNVVAEDGSFESEYHSEQGQTFAYTADVPGVHPYACAPHSTMGMRGALVVGDEPVTLGASNAGTSSGASGRGRHGQHGQHGQGPHGQHADQMEQMGPMRSFGGWLDDTDNYRGVADMRGRDEVRVRVGAMGNGGQFAFEPAAVHVDPGTTVVWEWVGTVGPYDVVDDTLGFASEQFRGPGHEFALRFGGSGVSTYGCTEYGDQGMRGVVLVGDGPQETLSWTGVGAAGAAGVGLAGALGYAFRLNDRTATKRREE